MIYIHICIVLINTHSSKSINLTVGGIANQVLQLLPAYEKIPNLKISLFSKYSEYRPFSNKVKIYNIHKYSIKFIDTLYFYLRFFLTLKKLHKKDPIHIINEQNYGYYMIVSWLIRSILHIPLFVKAPSGIKSHLLHAYTTRQHALFSKMVIFGWFRFFKSFLIKRIDFMQAINQNIYHELLALNYKKENLLYLPNGISIEDFKNIKKIEANNIHFGFVGRINKHKNIDTLLDAFKIYVSKNPNDKLLIYGNGPDEKAILNFIDNNNLFDNILFQGYEQDKIKIYSNIHVLIQPSYGEGISNAILEAMATGTFVIASNVQGNRDLIKDQLTGLLFNPNNSEDLLKMMNIYKDNTNLVNEILSNQKQEILKYDIDSTAKKIYQFLKSKLLEKKK